MAEVRLRFDAPTEDASRIRWRGWMEGPRRRRADVAFEFAWPFDVPFVPRIEPFLLAFLLPAMRQGHGIRLEDPVDAGLLENLRKFERTWTAWHPRRYRVVPIQGPATVERGAGSGRRALTCFSGGVDGCATLLRHAGTSSAGLDLRAALMIHGFDIPLIASATFAAAFVRARRILASEGVRALCMATDVRKLETAFDLRWRRETHGPWLAAALHCYAGVFELGLIPSTFALAHLNTPWASHPFTDPLLSSSRLRIVHEGACDDRLGKILAIADHPEVQRSLRVCWEGDRLDRNCGHCQKCVTTQVCFRLAGLPRVPCFPDACSLDEVAAVRLPEHPQRYLWSRMLEAAHDRRDAALAIAVGVALQESSDPDKALSVA